MKNKAFTLVELLAVIVILGVVLAIAVPKISDSISASKEESFFVAAKAIIRELDYLTMDNSITDMTALSELDFDKSNTQNYNLNESYAYIIDGEIYLTLVGINKYEGLKMCSISSSTKEYQLSSGECNYSIVP